MNWNQILLAVLGTFGTIDLVRLLLFPAEKRKVNAEADNVAIEGYKTALENLSSENNRLKEQHEKDEDEKKQLRAELAEKDARLVAVYDDICVHKGCRIRKPHQGQGLKWYEQYKDDPSLGCDYESIDTLIKRDRAKRLAENILAKEAAEGKVEDE